MSLADKIINQIDKYHDEIIEAQRAITALPALSPVNGGEGEIKKALVIQKWFEDLGLGVERVDCPDERVESGIRPNIIATLPGGDGPTVWVLSHMDVVPSGPRELWNSEPFEMQVEGDKLIGRGVSDNQSGLVSSFFGLKALVDLGVTPKGKVGLIAVADEETGNQYGLEHVLRERGDLFTKDDLIIVPDAGATDGGLIEVAEKSSLGLRVETIGKQVHSSIPERGVNALYASARMMLAVREVRAMFPQSNDLFDPPVSTMEPTKKEAGVPNTNTVPGRDVFHIDCRVLPEVNLDDLEQAFRDKFTAIAKDEGAKVDITTSRKSQAAPATDPNAPVVKVIEKVVKKIKGVDARPGGIGGGTVAAGFRRKGLSAAVWSTCQDCAHMPDEFCYVSDLLGDAKIFALIYAGLED